MTCDASDFRETFSQILALDITAAHPLLLHLLHRHEQGTLERAGLLGCFTDLASFVIRRSVCGESTRGYPLSSNPAVDFLNPAQGKPFNHQPVPGTGLYVFTNLSNDEKRDDLRNLVRLLEFPPDGIEVSLVD